MCNHNNIATTNTKLLFILVLVIKIKPHLTSFADKDSIFSALFMYQISTIQLSQKLCIVEFNLNWQVQ